MGRHANPNERLVILHLVRDPRAIMASRLKKKWVSSDPMEFREHCRLLCQHMHQKWLTSRDLPQDQFLRVYYEEWAKHPEATAEQIHAFFGLEWTAGIKRRIENVMQKDLHRRGRSFSDADLLSTIDQWRETLPSSLVGIVHDECGKVMLEYGYIS